MQELKNRGEWELATVLAADRFSVSVPCRGARQRGQRLQWAVTYYPTLRDAVDARDATGRNDAIIYACTPSGDAAPLSVADYERFMTARGKEND